MSSLQIPSRHEQELLKFDFGKALLIAQGEDGGYRRNMAARTPDS